MRCGDASLVLSPPPPKKKKKVVSSLTLGNLKNKSSGWVVEIFAKFLSLFWCLPSPIHNTREIPAKIPRNFLDTSIYSIKQSRVLNEPSSKKSPVSRAEPSSARAAHEPFLLEKKSSSRSWAFLFLKKKLEPLMSFCFWIFWKARAVRRTLKVIIW